MGDIFQELQDAENEHENGYQLKTNEELITIIKEFGNGMTEFHTVDIERLVIENRRMKNALSYISEIANGR